MNSNFLFEQTFKRVQTQARRFYFKVLGPWDPTVPALNDKVVISEAGWYHLHHKARNKFEMLTRYFAIPKITVMFSDPNVHVSHTKGNDGASEFWALQANVDGVETKIVVRSINGGHKHFYSVVWKGEAKTTKKEAASCLFPQCGGVDTPQLLNKRILSKIGKISIVKVKTRAKK
jgi:hypothetical protein